MFCTPVSRKGAQRVKISRLSRARILFIYAFERKVEELKNSCLQAVNCLFEGGIFNKLKTELEICKSFGEKESANDRNIRSKLSCFLSLNPFKIKPSRFSPSAITLVESVRFRNCLNFDILLSFRASQLKYSGIS